MIVLNWRNANPEVVGHYFIAAKLGDVLGEYDISFWDGKHWSYYRADNIIAHVPISELEENLSTDLHFSWQQGRPTVANPYLVLIENADQEKKLKFANWNGREWDCHFPGTFPAFVSFADFCALVSFNLPQELSAPVAKQDGRQHGFSGEIFAEYVDKDD